MSENTIQTKIDEILAKRHAQATAIAVKKGKWERIAQECDSAAQALTMAERLNPNELAGCSQMLALASGDARSLVSNYQELSERFNSNDLCIGVGGAGRMGKSTFLQAVTGLGEDQLPTSDSYFTTAGRSLIVNSERNIAVANMHTPKSFIENVLAPMCQDIGMMTPSSVAEFKTMTLVEPSGDASQGKRDIFKRLKDTQMMLPSFEHELTGQFGREISLNDLHDYVAYPKPQNGNVIKAGKFMAVADIKIYAHFPESKVRQLRVVDLPGLGEAGRELGKIQTSGMANLCDMTLLMKRPTDGNIEWEERDTQAIDAMRNALPMLRDQTKFTAILANVDGGDPARAQACLDVIERHFAGSNQRFEIIRCDARNSAKVLSETMPRILEFMVKNLPVVDEVLVRGIDERAEDKQKTLSGVIENLNAKLKPLNVVGNDIKFYQALYKKLSSALSELVDELDASANTQPDADWCNEIKRLGKEVDAWIDNGCGYGSKEKLQDEIRKNIMTENGQPNEVVNQLRIAFREQWEVMDEHLRMRIADIFEKFIGCISDCTNSFVPARPDTGDRLEDVRAQLRLLADKLENTPAQQPGDEEMLACIIRPIRRLAEFDLRFRFHLEPMLVDATEVLRSNNLPHVCGKEDAEKFTEAVIESLKSTAQKYSNGMQSRGDSGASKAKLERIVRNAIPDQTSADTLLRVIDKSCDGHQSFSPNRNFAAVIKSTTDAIIRSANSESAVEIWCRGYRNELREAPTDAQKASAATFAAVDSLSKAVKSLQNA
jgi:flagellar hook-basal body complex protein FliE